MKFSDRFLAGALTLAFFTSNVAVIATVPMMTGCNSTAVLTKVEAFEPVVLDVLNLYCGIKPNDSYCAITSSGQGVLEATIQKDYDGVVKLWSDYDTILAQYGQTSSESAAAWNALNAGLALFEKDSQTIFSLASGLNQKYITDLVDAAQVLLAAIEYFFPPAPASVTDKKLSTLFREHAAFTTKEQYTKDWMNQWVKGYNEKINAAKEAQPKIKLHKVHAHYLKFGHAQLGW